MNALIFGAGNVGRGFLGQLFSESGYQVVFADVDEPLVRALNANGRYTIRMVDNEWSQEIAVTPVRGLLATDARALAAAVSGSGTGPVWTFGQDLLRDVGGQSAGSAAIVWIVLGLGSALIGWIADLTDLRVAIVVAAGLNLVALLVTPPRES